MLCVWSKTTDNAYYKCRACVCGNFAEVDPTQQSWTAQAEPSSLISALKVGVKEGWIVSKHDVKGAFLNAKMPEGRIVVVQPPDQWVRWGLVEKDTFWTLDKAVYGLRESPALWSQERDKQLSALRWKVGKRVFRLKQCVGDSQVWVVKEDSESRPAILGLVIVYVDDFLISCKSGEVRESFLDSLGKLWKLDKR